MLLKFHADCTIVTWKYEKKWLINCIYRARNLSYSIMFIHITCTKSMVHSSKYELLEWYSEILLKGCKHVCTMAGISLNGTLAYANMLTCAAYYIRNCIVCLGSSLKMALVASSTGLKIGKNGFLLFWHIQFDLNMIPVFDVTRPVVECG